MRGTVSGVEPVGCVAFFGVLCFWRFGLVVVRGALMGFSVRSCSVDDSFRL